MIEVGFVGLGRMGLNMVKRMLVSRQVRVVVWNRSPGPIQEAVNSGADAVSSVEELVNSLRQKRKVVWLMLPAGDITERMFGRMMDVLQRNDIIIEGANSHFHHTQMRHKQADAKGVCMLDVGVSGGIIAASKGHPVKQ